MIADPIAPPIAAMIIWSKAKNKMNNTPMLTIIYPKVSINAQPIYKIIIDSIILLKNPIIAPFIAPLLKLPLLIYPTIMPANNVDNTPPINGIMKPSNVPRTMETKKPIIIAFQFIIIILLFFILDKIHVKNSILFISYLKI